MTQHAAASFKSSHIQLAGRKWVPNTSQLADNKPALELVDSGVSSSLSSHLDAWVAKRLMIFDQPALLGHHRSCVRRRQRPLHEFYPNPMPIATSTCQGSVLKSLALCPCCAPTPPHVGDHVALSICFCGENTLQRPEIWV